MRIDDMIARNIANALQAVPWQAHDLAAALADQLPVMKPKTRQGLILALMRAHSDPYPPSPVWLAAFFRNSPAFIAALEVMRRRQIGWSLSLKTARFQPVEPFVGLDIPQLATPGDLARWLDISPSDLDWLADARRQQQRATAPVKQHYRYHFIPKRAGPPRLVEEPKPRTKAIQRRLLSEILGKVPRHDAAHGFAAKRSCVTGAAVHAGEDIVLALDLKDFFARTSLARIHGLFRALGYPYATARLLTGLISNTAPRALFDTLPQAERHSWQAQSIFTQPHLPQGAPTSPALANLVAYRLDLRLAGLARVYDVNYTRYADDLTFSGGHGLSQRLPRFVMMAERIIRDEGYLPNAAKTRVMPAKDRQRVTGIVVNAHVNVARADYDRLKATLHNCARLGPQTQNRDSHPDFRAHLDGRISWVEQVNPARGQKLRGLFEAIAWT